MTYEWQPTGEVTARFEADSMFDPVRARLRKTLREQGWQETRLSMVMSTAPRAAAESDFSDDSRLFVLPMSSGTDSSTSVRRDATSRQMAVELVPDGVAPSFLDAWLQSPLGRESRRRANDSQASGAVVAAARMDAHALLRFADELIIPIPPADMQQDLAAADARLTAVASMVERARRELWAEPDKRQQLVGVFDRLFDDSLEAWVEDLPYPIASALWTLLTRNTIEAQHAQMFLVWEAYVAFTGTVLLSALAQDATLYETEIPRVRSALAKAGVSMEHASLGSWNIISQRLSLNPWSHHTDDLAWR